MAAQSLNPFATFQLQPRPWLPAEEVQSKFVSLAAKLHPDASTSPDSEGDFQNLTAAHHVLRDPVKRLASVLELEAPGLLHEDSQQFIPSNLPDLFMSIATLQREVGAFCAQRSEPASGGEKTTPLTRAVLEGERLSLRSDVTRTLDKLSLHWNRCEAQVQAANTVWERRSSETLRNLVSVHREMSYLQRWKAQLEESRLLLDTLPS